jgi:chaperonin GroEL (HSP60 family)
VTGGGSTEVELALRLKKYAVEIGGREQLAIQAFADALEVIPRTLAESCGLDPIDTIVDLRHKHEGKQANFGVDVYRNKLADMKQLGVIEPLKIKKQAMQSASEVTEMILRIDDIIASKSKPAMPAGGGPGGMGGMEGLD